MKITINTPYCFSQLGHRDNQEDYLYPEIPSPEDNIFMVCDGVGGEEGGEKASRLVCKIFSEQLYNNTDRAVEFTIENFEDVLKHTIDVLRESNLGGAATTMTFVCLNAKGIFAAHVGDSRIYQIRKGNGIVFQSNDHSLVAEYVNAGLITEQEAKVHEQKNIITRALDGKCDEDDYVKATVNYLTDIQSGDVILLCSDGVTDIVDDDDLIHILTMENPISLRAKMLSDACKESQDNNTAYIIEICKVEDNDVQQNDAVLDYDTYIPSDKEENWWDKFESFISQILNELFR